MGFHSTDPSCKSSCDLSIKPPSTHTTYTAEHPPSTHTKRSRRSKHRRNFSRTTSRTSSGKHSSEYSATTKDSDSQTYFTETTSSSATRPPPPYSRHAPSKRPSKRFQPPRVARTLATLDDLGALLFFRLPLYLGHRKTVYVLDDLGIWAVCRPLK